MFLPDFDKLKPRESTPEEHLKANLALNVLTALASLTLAVLLYANFLGRENTPVIIYITAGFLTAMFAWQAQVFRRNLKLRKHFKKGAASRKQQPENGIKTFQAEPANRQLNEADPRDFVPASVVERTTRKLETRRSA